MTSFVFLSSHAPLSPEEKSTGKAKQTSARKSEDESKKQSPQKKNTAVLFQFKLLPGEVLSVDKYQDIRIAAGGSPISREEKNRIVLRVTKAASDYSLLNGSFTTYSRSPRRTGPFHLERTYKSKFQIYKNGAYQVPRKYLMPNLRSMPSFPKYAVSPGEGWQAPASELMEFGSLRIRIPSQVEYRYVGLEALSVPGVPPGTYHRIEYKYTINQAVVGGNRLASPVRRISGAVMCVLWFDAKAGVPVYDSSRLIYDFQLSGGGHQEYFFRIESWYRKERQVMASDKEKIIADIQRELQANRSTPKNPPQGRIKQEKKPQDNFRVRSHKDGVVLELGDIFFKHNHSSLTSEARRNIKSIASILKKYPNREIRILGHTDTTGTPSYNQALSEKRALRVLDALTKRHGIDSRRLSYKGYGETRPIASNATKEGRARNRRVEVLIVTD